MNPLLSSLGIPLDFDGDIYTLDFESYWDTHYSLRKIPPIQYVRDDRFKAHGAAVKKNDEPAYWVTGKDLMDWFMAINWAEAAAGAHNSGFDLLVMVERFNSIPAFRFDTMAAARTLLPPKTDCDLETLGPLLKVGVKGKELAQSKGVRDLPPEMEAEIAKYSINDDEICYNLFCKLYPLLPTSEIKLINWTVRSGTEGVARVDIPRAQKALDALIAERERIVLASGYTAKQLRARKNGFPEILTSLGITPPTKISPANGKRTFAFAKDDIEFLDLIKKYPEHRALFDAKLTVSSNNDVKRYERVIDIGSTGNCTLPMPLTHYAAHTGRWGGTGKLNVQNFRRGSEIRKSIVAPEGYVIPVADSAQIELRKNAWFCGQEDSLEILRNNGDIYSHAASNHFGFKVTKIAHAVERQFGKILELGLGYGMGWETFQRQCAVGMMGLDPIYLSDEEAFTAVMKYRNTHAAIKDMWDFLNQIIPNMTIDGFEHEYKCIVFRKESIELPNGLFLQYPFLENIEGQGWMYGLPGKKTRIYGAKMLENIIQALARIVVAEQMLVIDDKLLQLSDGLSRIIGMTHDEGIAIAPQRLAIEVTNQMIMDMSVPPTWAPDLPVFAEGGWAREYSK